jgi:hypothetical protein
MKLKKDLKKLTISLIALKNMDKEIEGLPLLKIFLI